MKKCILAVAVLLALTAVLACACTEVPISDKLNQMLAEDYSKIILKVENKFDSENTLTSSFELNNYDNSSTLDYDVEQFELLDVNEIPQSNKKHISGDVTVKNGKVTNVPDEASNLPLQQIVDMRLDFNVQYVGRITTDTNMTAQISNPQKFFGVQDFDGKDVVINVQFGDVLQKMEITYTTSKSATVTLTFTFTK